MASVSAGVSTILASIPLHCAPNAADPAAVIKSTTCTGGTKGATGSGGASKGGDVGKTEAVGLVRLFAGIALSFLRFTLGWLAASPATGAVDSHHPSPASQHVSSGSSGARRSDRIAAKWDRAKAARSRASASGSRPPVHEIIPVQHTNRAG